MSKRIALASYAPTSQELDYHHDDERALAPLLAPHGLTLETVAWDAQGVDWAAYDAVLVRSTWDYHLRYEAFLAWLARLEALGVRLFNDPALMRWNMDKTYLATLQAAGVPLLPTAFYAKGSQVRLAEVMAQHGWQTAVVKPTVSAGGDNTWRVDVAEAEGAQARLEAQLAQTGVMIQQFAPQISAGEWSFLFFGGVYSHAARKFPAQGDMFVHEYRGGRTEAAQPTPAQIAQAAAVMNEATKVAQGTPLYARVDAVMDGDTLVLMELELVEPYLYLSYGAPHAAQRLAHAILEALA